MRQSFGRQLKNFALAVDAIDKEIYLDVKKLIQHYTEEVLEIDFTRQLIEVEMGGGGVGLMPFGLANKGKYKVIRVLSDAGIPNTQAAYSYHYNQPMWIVGKNTRDEEKRYKGTLDDCIEYQDLWKSTRDIPDYSYPSGEKGNIPIKTSILIPLTSQGRAFGVLNFETQDYLMVTDEAKLELKFITEAVAILYQRYLNFEENFNLTREAFSELNTLLNESLPKLTKPKVFLASSTRAEKEVIDILLDVLDDYEDKIDIVYWKNMYQPGNINAQLLKILGKCRFGICYMSEPDDEPNRYKDNLNVIFEAGMLHGRSDFYLEYPASWIPVRENNSEPIPFDFASERMVIIERNQQGKLDERGLKRRFAQRVEALLQFND
jgi:hypothetical protein